MLLIRPSIGQNILNIKIQYMEHFIPLFFNSNYILGLTLETILVLV